MADFKTRVWDNERIYLIDFTRAASTTPHRRFPEVDDVAFHDDANAAEHGQIVSAITNATKINVRLHRTEISKNAPLFVVSNDTALVTVTRPAGGQLPAERSFRIQFSTGPNQGRAAIEVRYGRNDGPVIGRLYVQVYSRINIPLRLHLVTVNGFGHANNFLGANCPTAADKEARMRRLVRKANEIWTPHGIVLTVDGAIQNTAWTATELGSATQNPTRAERDQAGALSPNRSAAHLNVYFIPQWSIGNVAATGIPVAWARATGRVFPAAPPPPPGVQHVSSGLYIRTNFALSPESFAHECGHYMTLCRIHPVTGAAQQWHSTGDTVGGGQVRDDIVTRRRFMYPITSLLNATDAWRNDVGYGNLAGGQFLTHRRLNQDITFEESQRARNAATGANFFAP